MATYNNYEITLKEALRPAITYALSDIKNPSARKSDYSKTITLPSSKELDKLFNNIFEVNVETLTFNANKKTDITYLAGEEVQLEGYLKLDEVVINDKNKVEYKVSIFGKVGDLFSNIGEKDLVDLIGLDDYNHDRTTGNQINSWDTTIIEGGVPVAFALGKGYVYPLIDYGFSSDKQAYDMRHLLPAIYAKEYIDRIFTDAGKTYSSNFFNSTYFKSLIIPFNEDKISLSNTQTEERLIAADTASQTVNTTLDTVIFPNEITDPSNQYDNTTGIVTITEAGYYDFVSTLDYRVQYTPSGNAVDVFLNRFIQVVAHIYVNGVAVASSTMFLGDETVAIPTTTTYDTGALVAYPSDAHNTIITTQNVAGVWSVASKADTKKTNPASNLRIPKFNIPLLVGDTVEIKTNANANKSIDPTLLFPFVDATGVGYSGTATVTVDSGKFLNTITNPDVIETAEIDIYAVIPKDVKQKDYLKSILNMHNLYMERDKDNPNNYRIEEYSSFFTNTAVDWQEKKDNSQETVFNPMGLLEAAEYLYSYKEDKDQYNTDYKDSTQEIYGQRSGLIDNDFVKKITKTDIIFSPTPIVGQDNVDIVVPTITKAGAGYETTAHNIRILYYGGLKTTSTVWDLNDTFGNTYPQSSYPYAGNFDDPYNPTLDINFGLPKKIYYNNAFNDITLTNNNLFNKYHLPQLQQVANRDSKLVSAYFYLKPSDISQLTFRVIYFFDNSYFRLYKIENYDPNKPLTKCHFIKVINVNPYNTITENITGGSGKFDTGLSGGVGVEEDIPQLIQRQFIDNNDQTEEHIVKGLNNYVDATAKSVMIIGNNNYVAPNVSNVVLINSSDLTITESNVTYIDDKQVESVTDFHNGFYRIESNEEYTIEENKQMVNFNKLSLYGTLNINGQLILK